jgi:hypothetical protein
LHAIDEPAARTAARIYELPRISAAQHADCNEATRCWLWQCEDWLLADCWQASSNDQHPPGIGSHSTAGALLSSRMISGRG